MTEKVTKFSARDSKEALAMRSMFGPQQIEQQILQAISMCWMMLPEKKRSADAVAREIRRIVERSLNNLKEDAAAFGIEASRGGR